MVGLLQLHILRHNFRNNDISTCYFGNDANNNASISTQSGRPRSQPRYFTEYYVAKSIDNIWQRLYLQENSEPAPLTISQLTT